MENSNLLLDWVLICSFDDRRMGMLEPMEELPSQPPFRSEDPAQSETKGCDQNHGSCDGAVQPSGQKESTDGINE